MRKILITGGPVHAYIDAVKLVTNRFKGGLMAQLARDLLRFDDCAVTYLCAKGSATPAAHPRLTLLHHDGFTEYRAKVCELAAVHTDVVLGAAVANLIPAHPIQGKFPSHNYKPGDIVPIEFMIAPRIIDDVKRVAQACNLFGCKLLSNAEHDELVHAAYAIVQESHALAVIANDTRDLQSKFIVTRERGVHPVLQDDLAVYLHQLMVDQYYSSKVDPSPADPRACAHLLELARSWQEREPDLFVRVENELLFGTVAERCRSGGFYTTARGKQELARAVYVARVDHVDKRVFAQGGKATLNAPLLDQLFTQLSYVQVIVHGHTQRADLPTLPYAPPGSVRDTLRSPGGSFNIAEHGCFLLFDADGALIRAAV